jgi:hypothetical protein
MSVNLTPFLVLGALLIVSVIVLIVWRKSVARGEEASIHVLEAQSGNVAQQMSIAQKLEFIDRWGKLLTIITVVYLIVVGSLLVYQQWVRASNLGV